MNRSRLLTTVALVACLNSLAWAKTGSDSELNFQWGPALNLAAPFGAYPAHPDLPEAMPRLFADPLVISALPLPAQLVGKVLSEDNRFRAGLIEAIDRQAAQHGFLWAHKMSHNQITPQSAALNGRLLDFENFVVLKHHEASPSTEKFKKNLIGPSLILWRQSIKPELKAILPSEEELFRRFELKFQEARRQEMVLLTGIHRASWTNLKFSQSARTLGYVLVKAAETGRYDMSRLMLTLAQGKNINGVVTEFALRQEIQSAYEDFYHLEESEAFRRGMTSDEERVERIANARARNQAIQPENCALYFEAAE